MNKILDYIFKGIIPPAGVISVLCFLFGGATPLLIAIGVFWTIVVLALLGVGIWMQKQNKTNYGGIK